MGSGGDEGTGYRAVGTEAPLTGLCLPDFGADSKRASPVKW